MQFTMSRQLVIEGGGLKEPWVVKAKEVNDVEFIQISTDDRKLAKAMGMNMSERNAWQGNHGVFQLLVKRRDDVVDELIGEYLRIADPLADHAVDATRIAKGRSKNFEDAQVPQVIALELEAFTTDDGDRVPVHTMKVVATPKRGGFVTLELTPENLNWFYRASHSSLAKQQKQARDADVAMPTLEQQSCGWRRNGNNVSIYRRYRTEDGLYKTHSLTPYRSDDPTLWRASVNECETKVQAFYDEHNVPASRGSAD